MIETCQIWYIERIKKKKFKKKSSLSNWYLSVDHSVSRIIETALCKWDFYSNNKAVLTATKVACEWAGGNDKKG